MGRALEHILEACAMLAFVAMVLLWAHIIFGVS